MLFFLFSISLSVIDIRSRRVPNLIILPAIAVILAYRVFFASEILPSFAAAGALFVIFLIPRLLMPGKIGGGDLKYAVFFGMTFPGFAWIPPLVIGLTAALLWIVAGGILRGKASFREVPVPLVPFLTFGGIAQILLDAFVR